MGNELPWLEVLLWLAHGLLLAQKFFPWNP